ncbi:MAG: hypothetical protein ACTSVY_13410 [Candidatus Helarchaeota archaeon]
MTFFSRTIGEQLAKTIYGSFKLLLIHNTNEGQGTKLMKFKYFNSEYFENLQYWAVKRSLPLSKKYLNKYSRYLNDRITCRAGSDQVYYYFFNIVDELGDEFEAYFKSHPSTTLFRVKNLYNNSELFQFKDTSIFKADIDLLFDLRLANIFEDKFHEFDGQRITFKNWTQAKSVHECFKTISLPSYLHYFEISLSASDTIQKIKLYLENVPFSYLRILKNDEEDFLFGIFEPPNASLFLFIVGDENLSWGEVEWWQS